MKKHINSFLGVVVIIAFIISTQSFGQDSKKTDQHQHKMKKECCKEKGNADKSKECCKGKMGSKGNSNECKEENHKGMNSSESLEEMDKNKDGKLFQCTMCPDQISDKAGSCKECGMELKEVKIEDIKKHMQKK
ncbi:MAG: hypothetical protein CO129_08730 [Ignavibacteriales bacterium CG_4_9_14_3_um_filter_34_10]|nr:MAG: hypothetical protein CO129_08730 [Ignavibacteriales bacterium CG_4_9_14_3_um_filter_34_10]